MEVYTLVQDMKVFGMTVHSFPNGIGEAYQVLKKKLGEQENRTFFGISYMGDDYGIIYKAAVLQLFDGEGEELGCESFVIERGKYIAELLKDWRKEEALIGVTFRKLGDSRPDTTFPVIEWYKGEQDVLCMVKLDETKR